MLGLLAALYSIYLIYTGIPPLMKSPQDKAIGYTAVIIVCGIVAALIVGLASSVLTRVGGGMTMAGMESASEQTTFKLPGTDITLDTAKIEEASRKMQEAQNSGDQAAAGKAMGDMMGAALGGKGGKPIEPDALKAFAPATLAGLNRSSIEARSDGAMGMTFSSVEASYANDTQTLELKMQDLGAMPALAMAMGAWANSTVDRETQTDVERVYKKDGVTFKEEYAKDGSRAEVAMMLGNGVLLEVNGQGAGIDAVRAAIASLDVKSLAALARPK